jgi:hypothetical protein
LVHVPYGSENIREVIREFDRDPLRHESIRSRNITESLTKHDWVYRWEVVLKLAGLEPLPKLLERKQRLIDLARIVESEPMPAGIRAG